MAVFRAKRMNNNYFRSSTIRENKMKILIVVDKQEDFVNGVFGSDVAKTIIPS